MRRRRVFIGILVLGVLLAAAAVGALVWGRSRMQASLPELDGRIVLAGLTAPVTVTRDALGVPTVRGGSRADVARATGFLHAQDRFFQMDLARRRAAGELSALVGGRALALDREIRLHRFRAEARRAISLMAQQDRAILDAYTGGVNSGLDRLQAPPFEYLVLRQRPQPWLAEDSLLVVLSMFITLQDSDGSYESTLATMDDVLPREVVEFMAPRGTEWDTPVDGGPFAPPPIPGAGVFNQRARRAGKRGLELPRRVEVARLGVGNWELGVTSEASAGSNNFAVSSRLTGTGAALVANDMHLGVRVPNTWYRAMLEWPADGSTEQDPSYARLIGITLPGVPALVVGSNTHVAWGFTNTYADWSDIVLLEIDPAHPNRYRTPDGWQEFETFDEAIDVAGQDAQHETVRWTIWGPVLGPDHRGRPRAFRWVAHSAERLAASVTAVEGARTLEEAFDAANGLGTPGQNFVAADRSGRIGWTVYGSIPRRSGIDGARPASWADGSRGWSGWLAPAEFPRLIDPPAGRIWTANARVVGGEMLAKLGDGSYEVGSRARIIRDRLHARDRFSPRDLLAIQLDARADFLARWRDLMLRTLTPAAIGSNEERRRLREILERDWTGEASPASAAYRFTRVFRETVHERVMSFVLADCYEADAAFDYTTVRRREGPIWQLVTEQPLQLLDAQFPSWPAFLLDAIDAVIADAGGELEEQQWWRYNVTAYRHPLSPSLPFIGRWLDMPLQPLPGDLFTPRMAWGSLAASQRMVVSPGREHEGIMHMPTGQSGHPLSPFYANSHDAWVRGAPTPFLPGPAVHTLQLVP